MARRFFFNAAALTGAKLLVTLSQVLILPIIAKYLTVEDFGAVALAMTVVIFAQLLSDAGIARSLIRQKKIRDEEWNTVYWFLVVVGVGLSLIMLGLAPFAAWAFRAPETEALIYALAIVPFVLALTAVPAARMERDEKFPQLAIIQLIAAIVGLVLAVWFAISGAGAWALIAQQIALAVVRFALVTVMTEYTYGLPRRFMDIMHHMRFGRDSIGVAFLFTGQRQLPVVLIGYFLGQAPLGLYSMSQRILNIPFMALTAPVSQVTYVRMTKLQNTKGAVASVFITMVRILSIIVFPPMLLMAAVAPDLFAYLLSEPWRLAGTIYTLAALGFALECVTSCAEVMFQAVDKSTIRVKMATERMILRTVAIAFALPFGIEAIGLAITLFSVGYLYRYLSYAQRADTFKMRDPLLAMLPALTVTVIGAALLYLWHNLHAPESGPMLLLQSAVMLLLTWGVIGVLQYKTVKRGLAILGN